MNKARLQFERVKRYYERIQQFGGSDVAYDDLLAFFQNCWHLKDHVKSCLSSTAARQVEEDVHAHRALRIVADIANRSKHVTITNVRDDARITHKFIHVYDGAHAPPATARFGITLADGSTYDAHNVATEAVQNWEAILVRHGL